jgi:transcriptional regulator with XRE-family HTH domain
MTLQSDGEAIRAVRLYQCGWTQTELAKRADISPAYLTNIEAGRRSGSPAVVHRIAKALGVPVAAIVKRETA